MTEKKCSKCRKFKPYQEFYFSRGRYRSECKKCTVRFTVRRYRERKRTTLGELSYSRAYYANNREKFAEYRRRFKERHPDYFRLYKQHSLNKKVSPNEEAH